MEIDKTNKLILKVILSAINLIINQLKEVCNLQPCMIIGSKTLVIITIILIAKVHIEIIHNLTERPLKTSLNQMLTSIN